MLTDIFAARYSNVTLWDAFGEPERRLLVQGFRILSEQICPYWVQGNENERGKKFWTDLHDRLSMELGVRSLSPIAYAYQSTWQGKPHTVSGVYKIIQVCENWMLKAFDGTEHPDAFIKDRLSLVELGFRKRSEEIAEYNQELPRRIAEAKKRPVQISVLRVPGDPVDGVRERNKKLNSEFQSHVYELNTRFHQAGTKLHYHNGFIQLSTDELIEQAVGSPFWTLVNAPKWKNVDTDMKEAIDRRDAGGRDPAFYAARALESTIKIVSDEKGWTTGREKGANNYIQNLASKNAGKFIADWEAELLRSFFSKVRNPLGHGPGTATMPCLSKEQTNWAIETCMVWIKSLIERSSA